MPFQEKINRLLQTTGIANNQLAKALAVDPSLISRWRNGSRVPTAQSKYIEGIAEYVVFHAKKPSQKMALSELLNLDNGADLATLKSAIANWLKDAKDPKTALMSALIDKINAYEPPPTPAFSIPHITLSPTHPASPLIYIGIEGKREAVLNFLLSVCQAKAPTKLYLYSDESMKWLMDDPVFFKKWALLLGQVLLKGNHIFIVHTVTRTLNELLEAIDKWLPLYMTGAIEPFYTTTHQESTFKRTLFVAQNLCSVSCESFIGCEDHAIHHFHEDQVVLANQLDLFKHLLNRSKPLMKIFPLRHWTAFQTLHSEFDAEPGNLYTFSSALSAFSMPKNLLANLASALSLEADLKKQWLNWHEAHTENVLKHLNTHTIDEIIALDQEALFHMPHNLFYSPGIPYTKEALLTHLKHMQKLIIQYPHYRVHFCSTCLPKAMHLSVKPDTGVVLIKSGQMPTAFSFNQPQMTDAFYHYMCGLEKKDPNDGMRQIESLIYKLTSALR